MFEHSLRTVFAKPLAAAVFLTINGLVLLAGERYRRRAEVRALPSATRTGWVWPLLATYGAFTALTDGVGKAWIADLVPSYRLGSGLGL